MSELPLIVFCVNETLLDLGALNPAFERIFGDAALMRMWFANLITQSEDLLLADVHVRFDRIGASSLKMLGDSRGVQITEADQDEVNRTFAHMPPYSEVPDALRKLRGAGFRLFTLSDTLVEMHTRQLEHAGILEFFEQRFSVDKEVRRHKPAPEAYAHVQVQLQVEPARLILVASHTWDTVGAVAAGWGAALLERPGNYIHEFGPQPTFVGSNLTQVADCLIQQFSLVPLRKKKSSNV